MAGALAIGLLGAAPAAAMVNGIEGDPRTYQSSIQLIIGERNCSGIQVEAQWVATAKACFSPSGAPLKQGPPPERTLTRSPQSSQEIREIVPHPDRDLVLAKLPAPAHATYLLTPSSTAPAVREEILVTGWGAPRTGTLQVGGFTIGSVGATSFQITGHHPENVALCAGDLGGPAFRDAVKRDSLLGIVTASGQRGCPGVTEPADGATVTRIDDLGGWIADVARDGRKIPGVGDGTVLEFQSINNDCLVVHGRESGSPASVDDCTRAANQRFELIAAGGEFYALRVQHTRLCLEGVLDSSENGSKVTQVACRPDRPEQQWRLAPNGTDTYAPVHKATGRAAQPRWILDPNSPLVLWPWPTESNHQSFRLTKLAQARHDLTRSGDEARSLRATNPGLTDHHARHRNGLGELSRITATSPALDRADASWRLVPGLADPSCYTFESANIPGAVLRHAAGRIRLSHNDGGALLAADATWCAFAGNSGTGVSFRSVNFPDHQLRHIQGELWSAAKGQGWEGGEHSYEQDTSWEPVAALRS